MPNKSINKAQTIFDNLQEKVSRDKSLKGSTVETLISRFLENVTASDIELFELARNWDEELAQKLALHYGVQKGKKVFNKFERAFPGAFREGFSAEEAVRVITKIESALKSEEIVTNLYRRKGADPSLVRFQVFNLGATLPLSELIPIFENMGLKVLDEVPYLLKPKVGANVWMHDFGLTTPNSNHIDLEAIDETFGETFERVWLGEIENDGFNAMVTSSGLSWRYVVLLRAYCKFLRQTGIPYSESYMIQTLSKNAHITENIIKLFESFFDPKKKRSTSNSNRIQRHIKLSLEKVQILDEDRILNRFKNLIEATLRTNFYQVDKRANQKPYISFKFNSSQLIDLPLPRPMAEIFVYSPRMEGIHLRGGKVARGGIRWSDRREDFRTEILGLMKSQMPKNSVIVPVGAKGGFVVKRRPSHWGRNELQREAIECYKLLISGMLDLTDNLKSGKVVVPSGLVRRDEVDPYLVVAADKGTATFSDIANNLARQRGFWLDDAFASGGSAGYDHKKMGITARGAWESVKRHFREMGVNTQKDDFTVIGVGDMSGDVFGNGMLLSKFIRLVAAFNHQHIFIDPDPDPKTSWIERKRLFSATRSSWIDYDKSLISRGGGVFERSVKSIKLTPQMRALLSLSSKESISPNDLVKAILTCTADLLWFGGIGTYVKGSDETDMVVGDRANDPVRVCAKDLRSKVIGEGANLGCTQLGRIEYSKTGGRINSDFIDNSAGVASSDMEVNIKITLGEVVEDGRLSIKDRNKLLTVMTKDVANRVLLDNYRQSMALTNGAATAAQSLEEAARFMRKLERNGELDRNVEFLPDDEEIEERKVCKAGLTRPEIAVLLAYAKMTLYDDLLKSNVPDDPWLVNDIGLYFPPILSQKYKKYVEGHRLRREISATYITNSLVNRTGPTFINELIDATGASAATIARAYVICRRVFYLSEYWAKIEALDNAISASVQVELHLEILSLIQRATRWFIQKTNQELDVSDTVKKFAPGISELRSSIRKILSPDLAAAAKSFSEGYEAKGVPVNLARGISELKALFASCDIVLLADETGKSVHNTAVAFFNVGAKYNFNWLRQTATRVATDNDWQKMAVSAIVDEVYDLQATLTGQILAEEKSSITFEKALRTWEKTRSHQIARLARTIRDLQSSEGIDLAMLSVAAKNLRTLIETSK